MSQGKLMPPKLEPNRWIQRITTCRNRNLCATQYQGRDTWTVIELLEAQYGQPSKKLQQPPYFCFTSFYQLLTVNIGEKSHASSRGRGKETTLKYARAPSLERSAHERVTRTHLTEGFYQSLTDRQAAHFSHPIPPKWGEKIKKHTWSLQSRGLSLTKRPRPNHKTIKCFPYSHTLP